MADAFLDTNVLLYLLTIGPKEQRARELYPFARSLSVQVLNEFASVARRKQALDWPEIRQTLNGFSSDFHIEPLTTATHVLAVEVAMRHQLNIYDGTIIAAALLAGCDTLYSEDMQHGLRIGGLTILNPFI